jgi:hypothetical protein
MWEVLKISLLGSMSKKKNKVMTQYIEKAALVAEIERRLKDQNKDRDFNYLQIKELEALLSFIGTLEVKEVDLEKEAELKKMVL